MNIAFFCDAYKPTRSGVAVSVETTAEELRARGHRVVIFAPRYQGYPDHEADVVRFHAGHWFRARDFPVAWPLLARLNRQARLRFEQEKFDIVHSHSPFTLGYIGSRWARRCGVPIVFTFHTLYHHYLHYVPLPRGFTRWYILWRVRNYCNTCNHIIAPSQPVEHIVQRLCPAVPTTVLPTGIDVERFSSGDRSVVRSRYGIAADEAVLLYVGRLVLEKNLIFLLRSLAPLLQDAATAETSCADTPSPIKTAAPGDLSRLRLMLVGGGPAMESLQALARELNIADRVIFTDFIESSIIADYYAAGDIFTFASRTETQGVSIAEALAAGLPCVVVGVMGAAEAIADGRNGFVVPPREAQFRDAVARLATDSTLRVEMASNARNGASSLSRERSVDRLLDLYDTLLPRHALPAVPAQA